MGDRHRHRRVLLGALRWRTAADKQDESANIAKAMPCKCLMHLLCSSLILTDMYARLKLQLGSYSWTVLRARTFVFCWHYLQDVKRERWSPITFYAVSWEAQIELKAVPGPTFREPDDAARSTEALHALSRRGIDQRPFFWAKNPIAVTVKTSQELRAHPAIICGRSFQVVYSVMVSKVDTSSRSKVVWPASYDRTTSMTKFVRGAKVARSGRVRACSFMTEEICNTERPH